MTQLEKTFQDMEKKSISCLDSYRKIWVDNEVIADDVILLKNNDKELDEVVKLQNNTKTEGQVAQKNQDITVFGKTIYKLGRNLRHMANKTNNKVLFKIANYSEKKLISGEEAKIILRFKAILAAARENLGVLAKYKVTAAILDGYDEQLTNLEKIPSLINTSSGERKTATRTIKELNKEARTILKSLDDAIEGMINDDKFIEAWFEARKIKGRHRKGKKENGSGNVDAPPVK
jgi:hypothetical protein